MPSEDMIVGLDIGTTKVCAVIGELQESGFRITGVGIAQSKGLRKGVVVNIEATMNAVAQAVESAEMMSGREVVSVSTGIAGGHIEGINSRGVVAVTSRGKEITQGDVDRVIDAAKAIVIPMDREVLHVIPQEFIVDDQGGVKNPIDMIGIRLEAEVHIITGSVTSAQNLLKCVNRAGFRVDDIILQSLAASKAVLLEGEKEMGSLLIDMGGGTTDVLLHLDGAPYHTNVISLGGDQVTSDLSIVLKIPVDVADTIKRQYGCCYVPIVEDDEEVIIPGVGGWPSTVIPRREMAKIIQPRVAETFGLIREQLEKKNYLQYLRGGIVLTGGGAMMPGVVELAQEVFGLPARIGIPTAAGGLQSEYQDPSYATAVGLALLGSSRLSMDSEETVSRRGDENSMMERLKRWMQEFF